MVVGEGAVFNPDGVPSAGGAGDRRSPQAPERWSDGTRHADLAIAASLRVIDGRDHLRKVALNSRPACGVQNDDGQVAPGQVLLVPEVLGSGDEDLEPGLLGCRDEVAIRKLRPAPLMRGHNRMAGQRFAQWCRCTLIEENLHSSGFESASGRVLQNGTRLLSGDTGEPIDEVVQRCAVFKVLEERRNRNARAAEDPSAADAVGVSLNSRTGGPVDHAGMVTPGSFCIIALCLAVRSRCRSIFRLARARIQQKDSSRAPNVDGIGAESGYGHEAPLDRSTSNLQ